MYKLYLLLRAIRYLPEETKTLRSDPDPAIFVIDFLDANKKQI